MRYAYTSMYNIRTEKLVCGLHVYWRAAVRSKGQKVLRTHNNNDGKSPPSTSTIPL